MLLDAIPGFEFPRVDLYDYTMQLIKIKENEIVEDDFVLGVVWDDSLEQIDDVPYVLVERSSFNNKLSEEEINILALLMK